MTRIAFYDSKSYDKPVFEALEASQTGASGRPHESGGGDIATALEWRYYDFHLNAQTALTAKGADVVCVFVNDKLDRPCLELVRSLGVGLVALRCAGFNNVDLQAAEELKLPVVRVPAYSPHAVAEHAVGLFLTLNRKIHRAFNRVRELNFALTGLVGHDVAGKTVGIIGTGKIGKITAQIFRGFDTRVIAYDPFPDRSWAAAKGVEYCGFDELLRDSEIISLHLPLTPESRYLLDTGAFAKMKKGVFIINTSRGQLINTAALIDALKCGRVGGVALDVYEEEEKLFFEDHSDELILDDVLARLITFPNVLVTAHQAFLTEEALTEIARVTRENVVNFATGRPFLPGTIVTK